MALPTWEDLVRPVLEYACEAPITRRSAAACMFEVIPLTAEEKEERIKSGPTKIDHRTGWAMSHLTKAGLIEKVARATYRATDQGRDFLKAHHGPITQKILDEKVAGYTEAWQRASARKQEARQAPNNSSPMSSDGTPEEIIGVIRTFMQ